MTTHPLPVRQDEEVNNSADEVALPFTHALLRLRADLYVQLSNDRRQAWALFTMDVRGDRDVAPVPRSGGGWAVATIPTSHPALTIDDGGVVDQVDVPALVEISSSLQESTLVQGLERLLEAREWLSRLHARTSPLTFRQAAQLLGMTPDAFGARMSREARAGRDYRRPAEEWPDKRTTLYDPAALLAWDATRRRRPLAGESRIAGDETPTIQ